jgi:hypothetical protein
MKVGSCIVRRRPSIPLLDRVDLIERGTQGSGTHIKPYDAGFDEEKRLVANDGKGRTILRTALS